LPKDKDYVGTQLSPRIVVWNTNLIHGGKVPKTFKQVLTNYPQNMSLPSQQWDWFGCMTQSYFETQLHMTAAQAIALFTKASSVTTATANQSLGGQLLVSGQFGVDAEDNLDSLVALIQEHAPIGFKPVVGPVCAEADGVAIPKNSPHPAIGLLFLEWSITNGPVVEGEVPTRIGSKSLGIAPAKYQKILPQSVVDKMVVIGSSVYGKTQYWENQWNNVISAAKTKPNSSSSHS
jgi:hypothetical protein